MADGLLTVGAKLGYKTTGSSFTNLTDLQSIGEIGGDAETVEVTRLSDTRRTYIKGLSSQQTLECKFLFGSEETDSWSVLKGLADAGTNVDWEIELPTADKIHFDGYVSVKLDGVEVGSAMTFTATLIIASEMVWA